MPTRTWEVIGMTCSHCEHAVTEELMEVDGVNSVSIELNPGAVSRVTVDAADAVADEQLAAAIVEAGYELAS